MILKANKSSVVQKSAFFFFLFIGFFSNFSFAQKSKGFYLISIDYSSLSLPDKIVLDSALTIYHSCSSDTCKLNALSVISESMLNEKVWPLYNDKMGAMADSILKSRKSFNEKEYRLLKKYYGASIVNRALILSGKGEYAQALVGNYKALKILESIDEKRDVATVYNNIAQVYVEQNNYNKGIEYHSKAIKLYEQIDYKSGIGTSYLNIALVYRNLGNTPLALEYYLKALKIKEKLNNEVEVALTLNSIGYIFYQQGEYDTALNYFYKSLRLRNKTGDKKGAASTLNNMALALKSKQDFGAASECLNKSIAIKRELNDSRGLAVSLANYAELLTSQKKYDEAFKNLEEALVLHKKLNNQQGIAHVLYIKGSLLYKQAKYSDAVSYLNQSLEISKANHFVDDTRQAALILYTIYRLQKKGNEALAMYELYITVRDSARYMESRKETIKQQMVFDFDKQRAADSIKVADAAKLRDERYNHDVAKQRTYTYAGIAGFLLMLALSIVSIIALRNKQRSSKLLKERNQIIQKQKNEVELKNKEISDSIYYAKKIQLAMLPSIPYFSELFSKRAFLIFGPRDIVSGDFYWYAEHNNKLYVAAADCTGHGVPGCLMSMISINILNDSIHKQKLDNPSEMLSYVNQNMKRALQQESNLDVLRDGMDIVLCCFDFKNATLSFAAANRPLYLIRNGNLTEYSGTKSAIGGLTINDQIFKHNQIAIEQDDAIYISTDGYADQFGGPKDKKMTTKRYKELLLSIQNKTVAEQGRIVADYFTEWAGKNEQVDDVLVIGIKV